MQPRRPTRLAMAVASAVAFTTAVTLRIPSCYESLWLDELHSAWCVWDSLADVSARAVIGHQSPFYFIGLWFWKQVFGGAEVALRLSSVLAVAIACVVLTIGVSKWTSNTFAGWSAGMVLATEPNSLFFGTELRPYAFVILFASIALACFCVLVNSNSRHDHRLCWTLFVVSILVATLCQPTALGVLAWFPIGLGLVWLARDRRQFLTMTILDGATVLMVAAVGFALWRTTLGDSWSQRSIWSSFARATHVSQVWDAWDWIWLWVVPAGLVCLFSAIPAVRRATQWRRIVVPSGLLACIAIVATSIYWIVSALDWVPLWHRRYFVAVLPIFPCIVGGAVATAANLFSHKWASLAFTAIVAAVLVAAPLYQQGTLTRLAQYPVALAIRGEGWREAIEWVRKQAVKEDFVVLDSGLIEAQAWLKPQQSDLQSEQIEYLLYPVRGPYRVGQDVMLLGLQPALKAPDPPGGFIITRRSLDHIKASLPPDRGFPMGYRAVRFGNVRVLRQTGPLEQRF